jgi:hypothetical protein
MEYHDKTFENKELLLDGNTYTGCTFRSCRLVITAAKPFHVRACNAFDCEYGFKDAAYRAFHTLQLLYQNGMDQTVEGLFQQIRQGKLGPGLHLEEEPVKPSMTIRPRVNVVSSMEDSDFFNARSHSQSYAETGRVPYTVFSFPTHKTCSFFAYGRGTPIIPVVLFGGERREDGEDGLE